MTREFYKKMFRVKAGVAENIIDFIFDDLNSRKCNNCISQKNCSVKRILLSNDEINDNYFYCNDWEKDVNA